MNGPEAAAIMRNTLQYSGPIVGNLNPFCNLIFIISVQQKCFAVG